MTPKIGNGPVHETEPHRRRTTNAGCDKLSMAFYTQSQDMSSTSAQLAEENTELNPCYMAALDYIERGWALLPLGPDKKPFFELLPKDREGKPTWSPFAARPATKAEVREWFIQYPDLNIGIICGDASGGLVVADFDRTPPKGLHLPITPTVKTSRGFHAYFTSKQPVSSTSILRGKVKYGEIQANGCYVVAPPSKHPDGITYQWQECLSLCDVELSQCPKWIEPTKSKRNAKPKQNNTTLRERQNTQRDVASKTSSILATCHGTESVSGLNIRTVFSSPEVLPAVCEVLGIPAECAKRIGKGFYCVLPEHSDTPQKSKSANLWQHEDGMILYHDWHSENGKKWYSLPHVYACQIRGKVIEVPTKPGEQPELRKPEFTVWAIRLLVDAGILKPAKVPACGLPEGTSESVKRVYKAFLHLLGCKWLHTFGDPTPFTWEFASNWCGMDPRTVKAAMSKLLSAGYVVKAGECMLERPRYGRSSILLFKPGTRPSANKLTAKDTSDNETLSEPREGEV